MTLTEEKILNGIKYFVLHTKNVGRTKLFKLLYFWDFLHFKKYGMSVTGYDYFTFPFGPVPKNLYTDIINDKLPDYLSGGIAIIEDEKTDEDDGYKRFKVVLNKRTIDYSCFSPNELNVLRDVACIYKDATAKEMTEITHLPNTPWSRTQEKGMDKVIDYFLAIENDSDIDTELIKERYNLHKELLSDGRI
ncbi:MAG: SocA family protein [Candidatus Latescibacteria bacterium]|nr:SocA family protein [Candidatus Latescibacterota bacterium]